MLLPATGAWAVPLVAHGAAVPLAATACWMPWSGTLLELGEVVNSEAATGQLQLSGLGDFVCCWALVLQL